MPRRAVIEHRGAGIVVEYRPDLFADAGFRALADQILATNNVRLHARALSLVLVSWNVTRAGRPVPITEGSIADLSVDLTTAIVRGIAADVMRTKAMSSLGPPLPWIPRSRKEERRP